MEQILKSGLHPKVLTGERLFGQGSFTVVVASLLFACASVQVRAQNLISNGGFDNALTGWTQASWLGESTFGINVKGPNGASAASCNYAYAGGGAQNLLTQVISGVTSGGVYWLTFQAGSFLSKIAPGTII